MTKKLDDALFEQKKQTSQEKQGIFGILGVPIGGQKRIEVPNRNSYVYVRLRANQSETIQAYNNQVAPSYGLPVIVKREGGRYVVEGVDSKRYDNNWTSQSPFLPRHGNTHSFDIETGGGGDIVWVYPRQIMPLLVFPSGSAGAGNVLLASNTIRRDDGSWMSVGNTGTANFTPYIPSSSTGAIMILVSLDSDTGNPAIFVNSGSVFSSAITGSSQIAQYIPSLTNVAKYIPLAAVRLVTGSSVISWENIYDVRQFVQSDASAINTGTLDATYLRIDTLNDPLTNTLEILPPDGEYGSIATVVDAVGAYIETYENSNVLFARQFNTGSTSADSAIEISRNAQGGNFSTPFLDFSQTKSGSGTYTGGFLRFRSGGTTRVQINEAAVGTGTVVLFDGDNQIAQGGMLLHLRNKGTSKFFVGDDGRVAISGNQAQIYHSGTNAYIESDTQSPSDLHVKTGAGKTLVLDTPVYGDLNFDPDSSGGNPTTLPDFVETNGVIYREFTNANNQLCGSAKELPHTYKLSGLLHPHLHVFLKDGEATGTTGAEFTLNWEIRQSTGISSGTVILNATTTQLNENRNRVDLHFPTGYAGAAELGAQVAMRLSRTGGNAGDVIVTTYGMHYPIDTLGSRQISSK